VAKPRPSERLDLAGPLSRYRVELFWSDEDQEFVATAPQFGSGVSALAETPEAALREMQVVLGLIEDYYQEEGRALPAVPAHSGQLRVRMPKSLHATLAARARLEEVSLNTLIVSYLSSCVGRIEGGGDLASG
jgi:antitoxin HicB